MGREVAERRRAGGSLALLLASALALTLLAGCAPERSAAPDGSATAGEPAAPAVPAADEPSPTSADLIAAALEAGEIDEPTSLLYRTWLFFGDPQLPEEFIGREAPRDNGLAPELRAHLPDLPEDVRSQIEPYLLRPDDPRSVFSAAEETVASDGDAPQRCSTRWVTRALVALNFRVWACDDPAALSGRTVDEAIDFTANALMEYAPEMIADMGPLIPDDPSMQSGEIADDRIDVYALPSGWLGPYRENRSTAPNYAVAIHSPPLIGNTTSSYVMVSLDQAQDQKLLERMMVHELFHVLQNTHHAHIDASWWTEGSAEWAAAHYVPSDSRRLHEVRLKQVMEVAGPSILLEDVLARYGAYIWPLFMEQQVGEDAVFEAWDDLASLPAGAGTSDVIGVLDQHLDTATAYPELAVRLVNEQLPGDPITPRFQDLDPNFPTTMQPYMGEFTLTEDPLELNATALLGLGYRDYRVAVETPPDHPADTGVLVRVSGQVATDSGKAPVLQALVRDIDGEYSRVRLAYNGDGDSVCVDEEMILVLANDSTDKLDLTEGHIVLERLDGEPCSRVTVNDPEYLYGLSDGDDVHVTGYEGDGEPDETRLVVTVRDPDPDEIDEYQVIARVEGGTLRAPRAFTWPLGSLDDLGEGVWRQTVPLPLDIDLTDDNRPLTVDARLVRSGSTIHSHSPTVILHGEQEPKCFVDAEIHGTVMHQISMRGSAPVNRPYPVDLSQRFDHQTAVAVFSIHGYESTFLQFMTDYPGQPDPLTKDQFRFAADDFGRVVPEGATGTFALDAHLTYYDYTNVPWVLIDEDTPLPNQGLGQPQPGDALSSLDGEATLEITRNLPSSGIVEGTVTGTLTDEESGNRGTFLDIDLTFAYSDEC